MTLSFPCHDHNKGGESSWGLKIGHRCNETSQRPIDGGGPTWCALYKRKHLNLNKIKRITSQVDNQVFVLGPAQDFKVRDVNMKASKKDV